MTTDNDHISYFKNILGERIDVLSEKIRSVIEANEPFGKEVQNAAAAGMMSELESLDSHNSWLCYLPDRLSGSTGSESEISSPTDAEYVDLGMGPDQSSAQAKDTRKPKGEKSDETKDLEKKIVKDLIETAALRDPKGQMRSKQILDAERRNRNGADVILLPGEKVHLRVMYKLGFRMVDLQNAYWLRDSEVRSALENDLLGYDNKTPVKYYDNTVFPWYGASAEMVITMRALLKSGVPASELNARLGRKTRPNKLMKREA